MNATMQRGKMPEAERLARRERRILKRVARYEALMDQHRSRREDLVELLFETVVDLERLSPEGAMPPPEWSKLDAGKDLRRWFDLRERLYRMRLELAAMGERGSGDA